jgi:hypothetical protein
MVTLPTAARTEVASPPPPVAPPPAATETHTETADAAAPR